MTRLKDEIRFPGAIGSVILFVIIVVFYLQSTNAVLRIFYLVFGLMVILSVFKRVDVFHFLPIVGVLPVVYGIYFYLTTTVDIISFVLMIVGFIIIGIYLYFYQQQSSE